MVFIIETNDFSPALFIVILKHVQQIELCYNSGDASFSFHQIQRKLLMPIGDRHNFLVSVYFHIFMSINTIGVNLAVITLFTLYSDFFHS